MTVWFTGLFGRLERAVFSRPYLSLGVIFLLTAFFALQIPGVRLYSDFADLLPQDHPYIQLHNEIRDTFGGANVVIVGVEVETGTIFTNDVLAVIYRMTQAVDSLPGVNHNMVTSLTHRTARKTWLSENGAIVSQPYYDADHPDLSPQQLQQLANDVLADPRAFGLLVSPDLKAAVIKGQLNEGALDYRATFDKLQAVRRAEEANGRAAGVRIYAMGQPVLIGWLYTYLPEIAQIFLYTMAAMIGLLILYFRRLYGVLVPLAGIALSTAWGLGIMSLLGFNLDPLTLVVPFLISARALSHGVQLVERYYLELATETDSKAAARKTFNSLFRPGSLGVVSDGIGLLTISLGSIPLNTKLSYYGALWALCVIVTVLLMVPLLLSVLPQPKNIAIKHNALRRVLPRIAAVVTRRAGAATILVLGALCLAGGGYLATGVVIGESEPGSPLLYPDHDYNISAKAINARFPGSEELYIVARTENADGMKRPEVIHALEDLQTEMMYDPELGGAKGLPDLVKQVNRLLHNDDPRWMQIPDDANFVGGLLWTYMASSPIPDALREFINPEASEANMVFFYKDHRGATIKRAIAQVKAWEVGLSDRVEGLTLHLAGGLIGVNAAINEAVFRTNYTVIPLVLLLIFVFVGGFYRSVHAGWLMLLAMTFGTTLSYAYLGISGVGLNVNTVPIIAVGIGTGIDYSIYIMDRIREEMAESGNLRQAVARAIGTTGLAVCITATTLIAGIMMWVFMSTMRFQADAALLLVVMITLTMTAALFLVPAWVIIFRPDFIVRAYRGAEDRENRHGR